MGTSTGMFELIDEDWLRVSESGCVKRGLFFARSMLPRRVVALVRDYKGVKMIFARITKIEKQLQSICP